MEAVPKATVAGSRRRPINRQVLYVVVALVFCVAVALSSTSVVGDANPHQQNPHPTQAPLPDPLDNWRCDGFDVVRWPPRSSSCAPPQATSRKIVVTMEVGGWTRYALVFLPGTPPVRPNASLGTPPAPGYRGMMMMSHGLGGSCSAYIGDGIYMSTYLAERGIVLVAPCGMPAPIWNGWNAGVCCLEEDDGRDDVAFARAVVDAVSNMTCTDFRGRVMAAGYSNGGMLSEMLGCTSADVFSAVASVTGVVAMRPGLDAGLRACDDAIARGAQRPHVLMIHGDADNVVPWSGQNVHSSSWIPRLPFPDMPSNAAAWATRNGCVKPPLTTLNTTEFETTQYADCQLQTPNGPSPSTVVELTRHKGGDHIWLKINNTVMVQMLWDFGSRYVWNTSRNLS